MIFNINLETGDCWDEIEIDTFNRTVNEVIAAMQAACVGLTDAAVVLNNGDCDGDPPTLAVGGNRMLTDRERDAIVAQREHDRRLREHMAKFRD